MTNDNPPRISVVIPAFNAQQFLQEAIESVLSQGLPLEVVVVNDGSTDRTAAVAERMPVRLISQANAGTAVALNAGIAHTTADLLAFLDADDLWTAGRLREQLAVLDDDESVDAVFGHVKHFEDVAALRRHNIEVAVQPTQPCQTRSAMLIRRHRYLEIGPFKESKEGFAENLDWSLRAIRAGLNSVMLNRVVLKRRLHGDNKTLRNPELLRSSQLAVLRDHMRQQRDID